MTKFYIGLVAISIIYYISIGFDMYHNKLKCHRKRERTLKFMRNNQYRICARCLMMYIGIGMFPLTYYVTHSISILILILIMFIAQIPLLVDGFTQYKKLRVSNNYLRSITGIVSGLGLSLIIVVVLRIIEEIR